MRLIRLKEVMNLTGLGRSSIYKFMAENKFPQSISLGERAIAWEQSEIEEWISAKIEERVALKNAPVKTYAITEVDVVEFLKNKFNKSGISEAITWIMKVFD